MCVRVYVREECRYSGVLYGHLSGRIGDMDDRTSAALDALQNAATGALRLPALSGFELWADRDDRGAFLGSLTLRIRDIAADETGEDSAPKKPPRRTHLGNGSK